MATISPSKEVNKLFDKLLGYFNPKDQAYINRAFHYAYDGHNGQNRKSGEPYITHPLHVAIYLCDLNFDKDNGLFINFNNKPEIFDTVLNAKEWLSLKNLHHF